jgi:RNA polymerase sigma factor (sigma-70 family)
VPQNLAFNELMADVASGSEKAIWQLAETYTPHIIRVVRLSLSPRLRQKIDSCDIAQTLWASLLLKRPDLTRLETPDQLIAYLARAARNKVIDKARHYTRQKKDISREEPLPNYVATKSGRMPPHNWLISRECTPSTIASQRERLAQILLNSSERDRDVFRMRLKGCTFDDISVKLNINQATARRVIDRFIRHFSDGV